MSASAPAKTILFGEHAVVYNEPAIAIPLPQARTTVSFVDTPSACDGFRLLSQSTGLDRSFASLSRKSPLKILIRELCKRFGIRELPAQTLLIESDIPVAAGLGSGAALSVAIIRAFMQRFQKTLSTQKISDLAYQIEIIYHGNPSGIDNTVIAFEQPLIFRRGQPPRCIEASKESLHLLVVDSGIRSRTADVVADVRLHYAENEASIHQIGRLIEPAIIAIKSGDIRTLGSLMNENQTCLEKIHVSCPALDEMIAFAREQGALGAKLTGAGRGGNIIALAENEEQTTALRLSLLKKGMKVIA